MRPAPMEWPNGAKIAVSFFVAFEGFIKHSQYRASGDRPDFASLAYGDFGGRAGIWRIMDILSRHHVKGTIDLSGLAAEKFPDAVKELHAAGHEIVGHGWANDISLDSLDRTEERKLIKDTLHAIRTISGAEPVGWVSPGHRRTEHTFGFLVEEGIFWTGDMPGDEIPYHIEVDGKPFVIMPRLDYANDLSLLFGPKNPPSVYWENFKAAFDLLYAEGQAGSPKVIDALVHAHIGGRAHIAPVFEKCIRYAKGFPDVWFCTKGEIARWYLDHHVE